LEKKSNMSLVSIIMPNYNGQDYIADTIESIINQTYRNFELIIIDDCSTDDSINIIKRFQKKDSRIKLFQLNQNSGRPAIPRNYGIKYANGDYIAFIDSDDIWHKQKLEIQLSIMKKNGVSFSCTSLKNFKNIKDIEKIYLKKFNEKISIEYLSFNKLLKKNTIPNSSVIIKKNILKNVKFIEDMRYKAIEDYHLWLKISEKGIKILKINNTLLFYRLSQNSISKSKLSMLKKIYMLYSEYEKCNGEKLGIYKYYFFLNYIYFSIIRVIKGKL